MAEATAMPSVLCVHNEEAQCDRTENGDYNGSVVTQVIYTRSALRSNLKAASTLASMASHFVRIVVAVLHYGRSRCVTSSELDLHQKPFCVNGAQLQTSDTPSDVFNFWPFCCVGGNQTLLVSPADSS